MDVNKNMDAKNNLSEKKQELSDKDKAYQESHVRTNILKLLDEQSNEKIREKQALYIGEECKVIQDYLQKQYGNVSCDEDVDGKLAAVVCIYPKIKKDEQVTFLKKCLDKLFENGRILLAVPNKYSIKNIASGLKNEEYAWSMKDIERVKEKLLEENYSLQVFYPYPNALFATDLYSDAFLPVAGSVSYADLDFGEMKWASFDLQSALNNYVQDGMFQEVAESYLLYITKNMAEGAKVTDETGTVTGEAELIYTRFSVERAEEFRTVTDILQKKDGTRLVYKTNYSEESKNHIERTYQAYCIFKELYKNTKLIPNRCEKIERKQEGENKTWSQKTTLQFEYLTGESLEDKLVDLFVNKKNEEAFSLMDEYVALMRRLHGTEEFVKTQEFVDVFGNVNVPEGLKGGKNINVDLIFQNILLGVDNNSSNESGETADSWNVIDYEWTFDFVIPVDLLIYRSLFYFYVKNGTIMPCSERELYERYNIDVKMARVFYNAETNFQNSIMKNYVPVRVLAGRYQASRRYVSDIVVDNQLKDNHIDNITKEQKKLIKEQDNLKEQIDLKENHIKNLEATIKSQQYHINKLHKCIKNPVYGGVLAGKKVYRKVIGNRLDEKKREKAEALTAMYHEKYKNLMKEKDSENYEEWIKDIEKTYETGEEFAYRPKISVLVPVYNVLDKHLVPCIESVLNQTYDNWELCLADDASTWDNVKATLKKYENGDKVKVVYRTENGHISRSTNSAMEVAIGEFIAFLDCDDLLAPNALYEVVKCLNENPDLDFIYSDEDKVDDDGTRRHMPHFKPDWSPDTLLSHMYTCHLGVYRKTIADEIGGLRVGYEGSQDYDFVLRYTEKTDKIAHIAKILYHWREREESTSGNEEAKPYVIEATRKCKEDALKRRGINAMVIPLKGSWFRIVYGVIGNPKVSILIPSKDNYDILERCINSIYNVTKYRNFEIVLVDNGSNDENKAKCEALAKAKSFTYVYEPMTFNFSKMCNLAASYAIGDYYVFLNDDTEVIEQDWLSLMLGQAQQTHVGAVGAKLLYPETYNIQHVGVLNLQVGPAHAFSNFPDDVTYYFARNKIEYNYCAVTAACLMVDKTKFDEVGGFEESLAVAYNDVEFCFKLLEKGYYNVVRTDARLLHYESISRGNDLIDPKKIERLQREQQHMYEMHPAFDVYDPFYNINLAQGDIDFTNNMRTTSEQSNKLEETEKEFRTNPEFIGNVDIVRKTKMLYIEGWAYYTGYGQNNDNEIRLLLESDTKRYIVDTEKVYRQDVAKGNPQEINIEFTGFRLNVPKAELEPGEYKISIVCGSDYLPDEGNVKID